MGIDDVLVLLVFMMAGMSGIGYMLLMSTRQIMEVLEEIHLRESRCRDRERQADFEFHQESVRDIRFTRRKQYSPRVLHRW